MQYGAVKYTPSNSNGNWTSLCQVAAQARSIGYGTSRPDSAGDEIPNFAWLRSLWSGGVPVSGLGTLYGNNQTKYPTDFMNKPASYMAGTKYFDSASAWYPSLQQSGGGTSNTDFLTNYFMSAMQTKLGATGSTITWSTALSGSDSVPANTQILEKSSTYFVATTHAMYYLQLAEDALAKNDTAGAKNHFDSVAALYFGCGDTNPVPLPVYTPDTVVTTSPQENTQIKWTADTKQLTGDGGTLYSLYNLANTRASNYGNCGALKNAACKTTKTATTTAGSVTVANLNLLVEGALNYGTGVPTTADVNTIRDSINIINAQAAQTYIARVTLDAQTPGNGLGGSLKRVPVDVPATALAAYTKDNANGKLPTACGGSYYQVSAAVKAANAFPATTGDNSATLGAADSGTNKAVARATTAQMDGTAPPYNAPCGSTATATGTVVSNTATMKTVMSPVKMVASGVAGTAPYTVSGTAMNTINLPAGAVTDATGTPAQVGLPATTQQIAGGGANSVDAMTTQEIIAATRGQSAFDATADYSKITPIGCIDRSVRWSVTAVVTSAGGGTAGNWNAAATARKMTYAFCDPRGYAGVALATADQQTNLAKYVGTQVKEGTGNNAFLATVFGGTSTTLALVNKQGPFVGQVWDPIMAAQLSEGAFCCDAAYYGPQGVGRAAYSAQTTCPNTPLGGGCVGGTSTGAIGEFNPPLTGGDLYAIDAAGSEMCPVHSSGNGANALATDDNDVEANSEVVNPAMTELLEGQAFYAALGPSQYSLPVTSTTAATQTARAAKQRRCAEEITAMMKINKADATTCTTTTCNSATGFINSYSAINFPLWQVGIGAGNAPAKFTVPSGYCYANACLEDFATIGTQSTFKGAEQLGALVSGPNMALASDNNACGRANGACVDAPSNWNGGSAAFALCAGTSCTAAGVLNSTGTIPVV